MNDFNLGKFLTQAVGEPERCVPLIEGMLNANQNLADRVIG
jgi:hypothetical protein